MSGSTRDPAYYGDRLVYEPLESKWSRYHATHRGCGWDWLEAHAIPLHASCGVATKAGYRLEGTKRNAAVHDGRHDMHLHARVRGD